MTAANVQTAIRLVMDLLSDRGWPDRQGVGLAVVRALLADPAGLSKNDVIEKAIPTSFLVVNGVNSPTVAAAIQAGREKLMTELQPVVLDGLPAIVQLDDIDSFSQAGSVDARDVSKWAAPFDVPEDYIKRMVAEIVGEPYVQKDWGGELDDMFSGQSQLHGRRVTTTFMFKGRGLKTPMKPKNLGKNGDQIDRMLLQPAELHVVQHVHKIEPSVRRQLERGVVARRADGHLAVGSVWDGVDTARLAAAYGYLDLKSGELRPLEGS